MYSTIKKYVPVRAILNTSLYGDSMMPMSLSKLRANLFKVADEVLETGIPVEIERNGQRLQLAPIAKKSKLDNLKAHPDFIVGDIEEIVHMDWSEEWQP